MDACVNTGFISMTFWNLGLSTKTEQEQAYLNIIHDVKTTDKDADADK